MFVATTLDQIMFDKNTAVTVGTFDGVHIGHQKIINELIRKAKKYYRRSILITFDPHPREVVGRGPTKLLTTIDERLNILSQSDIDIVYIINFTFEFSRLSFDKFYKEHVFNKIGMSEVIVGHNHMFGRDREANINHLIDLGKSLGFKVDLVPPVLTDGIVVSSSIIRETLFQGNVALAKKYLGRAYTIDGKVVNGKGRGKTIGFPTANIKPNSCKKLIPAEGVYLVSLMIENHKYFGMLNIGYRPTFKEDTEKTIEVHIFNFDKSIYDLNVSINFYQRIRSELKFNTINELIEQLRKDKLECTKIISLV